MNSPFFIKKRKKGMDKKDLYRECIICGSFVKVPNLQKHFEDVHPLFVNELKWVKVAEDKGLICGNKTSEETGICQTHRSEPTVEK
jgi:hypothetical protein